LADKICCEATFTVSTAVWTEQANRRRLILPILGTNLVRVIKLKRAVVMQRE